MRRTRILRTRPGLMALLACAFLVVGVLQAATASARRAASAPAPKHNSVLFWLGWDGGRLGSIPWSTVTQVDLFSLSTCAGSGDPAGDCVGPTSVSQRFNGVGNGRAFVRAVHQHGKAALISIGGSTNPNWYYACNPSNVKAFAKTLVSYMKSNGFDGIDLDVEQDAGTGSPALTAADLRACTRAVHDDAKAVKTARGGIPLITSDVDPTTDFDIGRIQGPYVDQFNAMSYGASGSALASQISALERQSRIPASKITAGVDLDDYPPPKSDCAGLAHYAATAHLNGVMLWYAQADAPQYACLRAMAQLR